MPKISSRSMLVPQMIRDRVPFTTHGALYATDGGGLHLGCYGYLLGADLDQFRADVASIDYVVFSYSTPIAWHTTDGRWHRVSQKFSMTTSHHQGRLYLIPDADNGLTDECSHHPLAACDLCSEPGVPDYSDLTRTH